jgi:hypothetical protein
MNSQNLMTSSFQSRENNVRDFSLTCNFILIGINFDPTVRLI